MQLLNLYAIGLKRQLRQTGGLFHYRLLSLVEQECGRFDSLAVITQPSAMT